MLKIPRNCICPKNQKERMKLDEKENYEMDLFQERMKSDLEKIKIHAIKPIVPKGIFPISQKNSAFSDLPYGKISTVSNAGCGPLAMEYAFRVNGFNVDFEELVNEVSKKEYRGYIYDEAGNITDGCGTEYSLFDNTAERLYDVYQILKKLQESVITILIQNLVYNRDKNKKGNHFISLIGIDEEQNGIFMDGNLIIENTKQAMVRKTFKEMALGFRGAWAWNRKEIEKYLN